MKYKIRGLGALALFAAASGLVYSQAFANEDLGSTSVFRDEPERSILADASGNQVAVDEGTASRDDGSVVRQYAPGLTDQRLTIGIDDCSGPNMPGHMMMTYEARGDEFVVRGLLPIGATGVEVELLDGSTVTPPVFVDPRGTLNPYFWAETPSAPYTMRAIGAVQPAPIEVPACADRSGDSAHIASIFHTAHRIRRMERCETNVTH